MIDEKSREEFVTQVVSTVNKKIELLAHLLMDNNGEGSSLDNFAVSNDPEFTQFLNCIDDLEECSQKTIKILENFNECALGRTLLNQDSKVNTDGVFVKLDRLSQAVGELEYEISKKELDYIQIVRILGVAKDALETTATYHEVSPFDSIYQRYCSARSKLKKILFFRYREATIFAEPTQAPTYADEICWTKELSGANNVIDALGKDVAKELTEVLIDSQLMRYHARGRFIGGNLYSLQKEILDQRWDELYRMLGASSAVNIRNIVSNEWNLPFACYVEFSNRTAEHLRVLLSAEAQYLRLLDNNNGESGQLSDHVTMLVQVLESTLNIENEVHKMFDKGVYTVYSAATNVSTNGSANGASRRLSASSRMATKPTLIKRTMEEKEQFRCTAMSDMIAENFMDPYVKCERRNAEDALADLINEDIKKCSLHLVTPESDQLSNSKKMAPKAPSHLSEKELSDAISLSLAVYDSATVLFQITRSSMLRCAALSNGKPLMSLLLEYKVVFQMYAEMLRTQLCPEIPASVMDIHAATRKQRVPHPLKLSEEVMACRAIMTADYCIGLIPDLEAEMQYKMNDKYKEDVYMKFQCVLFEDVISYAIDILVSSLLGKLDEASLVHMANTDWAKFTIVGDVSPYVFFMSRALSEVIPRLRKVLPEDYFDTLCSRFSSDFLDRFLALLMGLRTLGVAGAQQMLLDVNEMKPVLLNLHTIESRSKNCAHLTAMEHAPIKSPDYDAVVNKKVDLLCTVLKLILSDDKQIDETFNVLWPEGKPADLKTIKKLKSNDSVMSALSLRDSDLNQYLDRRTFNMDASIYTSPPRSMFGTLTSGLGKIKKSITPNKKKT